ncbi:translation initiation factor IF-2 N-terminal domain-containing protein [Rhodococcus rhodochrous]|nr:translation initiation factor IF-2 N-terminal domain-containing protein [Rhodococcus rhodochrous]MCD2095469.1 translation initiation factor IF-2 N-terminal domain-containing protein [Rhodococcus rhodochrous]MCD2120099.1 translation initiation factor IF-2 N-terminal domain-containing protein [Rhodococcus rhodochrous]MCQ4134376.1 translation initiation factor IF-2 N-terminal domain-containing protein [Rhodococcus rhodochrous]MDJ0016964.1 translation initiation factor IF-2 N-terminal domain-con
MEASDAGGRNLLGLPAKIRVHALAKLLGLTSKQVIAKAAERGTELRSAHSTLPRDVAEDLHAALSDDTGTPEPAVQQAGTAPETAEQTAPEVETAPEPVAEKAAESTEALPVESDDLRPAEKTADETAPQALDIPSVGGPTGLFTSVEQSTPLFEMPEPSTTAEPIVAAPLFLQPEVPSPAEEEETRPRRRRARRGKDTEQTPVEDEQQTAEPAAAESTEEAPSQQADEDQDDQPRRRRRGRRGRGRGRGDGTDTDQQDETTASGEDSESSDAETDKSAAAESTAAETPAEETAGAEESTSDEAASGDDQSSDEHDSDDEQGGGTSRRRRRRRRRRGSDTDTASTDDDSVPTVVHEREPRPKSRAKDEVQGISGSTRLEAKRQRRRDGREAGRRRPPILTESEFLARREAVDRVMVVRERTGGSHAGMTQVAVLEDGILVEHFVTTSGSASMVGNIYLGRVQNVLPSMEAAFIDIGRGRNGVLYAGEVNWEAAGLGGNSRKIEQALKPGDQVVVQVSKDPVGHKGARLTTQISLAGRFLVYVPGGSSTGISRKLPDTERKRLKDILREIVPSEAGVIIRTAAEGVSEEELSRDVTRLQTQWEAIREQSEKLQADASGQPKTLYEEPDLLVKVVRDLFNEDFSKLVIEGDSAWNTVESYIRTVAPDLLPRVERYRSENSVDVFGAHRIDEQLAKALDRKVWLPSGGTLVIDRTEAMTVIDVNTGKFTGSGGNLEETVTRNNLEAAEEIVRQMRLRDIGGMIVVDFIDMVLESNRDLVLRRLTEALGRDRTRHQVSEVTSLGLVQMTRKRLGTGLVEAFSTTCEHCNGRGLIVHSEPIESKSSDDSGRSSGGGSRRKRGRDKSSQEPAAETHTTPSPEEVVKRAAHPVALAMAAHHSTPAADAPAAEPTATETASEAASAPAGDVDPVKVTEPLRAVEPEKVAAPTKEPVAGEDATTVTTASDEPAEIEAEVAAAESAVADTAVSEAPVAETAVSGAGESTDGAASVEAAEPAPRRRRARRVARAAAAPAGDGGPAAKVFVVPATTGTSTGTEPDSRPSTPVETPVEIVRRPRSRRAAGRPAGPPVDAEA